MAPNPRPYVEYMCRYCGKTVTHPLKVGKPLPGKCPERKKSLGQYDPHIWIEKRKFILY